MAVELHLSGVDELRRALSAAAKQIRTKAVRSSIRKAAGVIGREAKRIAPVLKAPTRNRKPGTVKKAIAVRRSKFASREGNEGAFVNVRPLRGSRQHKLGKAGAKNPNDPYYWLFLEFGTKPSAKRPWGTRAQPFLLPAVSRKGTEAVNTFMKSVVPQIEKLNQRANRVG